MMINALMRLFIVAYDALNVLIMLFIVAMMLFIVATIMFIVAMMLLTLIDPLESLDDDAVNVLKSLR